MTPQQFQQLAKGNYNRIPLIQEVLADMDTPLSTYRKLADTPYSYLFESVQGGEKWGRYSIIGLSCDTILRVSGNIFTIEENGIIVSEQETSDPLQEIAVYQQNFRVPEIANLPRFTGGLVGYFGYDCIRYIEPRLGTIEKPDPLQCPDILLMVSDRLIVFDNLSNKLHIIVHANPRQANAYEKAQQELASLANKLLTTIPEPLAQKTRTVHEHDFISGFTQKKFEQGVQRIKDYIVEGDVMQVALSQQLSIPFQAPALNVYRALRFLNPSPYMFYMNLKNFYVVGSSPEILVRREGNQVVVRPIAGTRPRGRDEAHDLILEQELLQDPKERAEHLMLIDLGRNDIGRVAKAGTVQLTDTMIVERYSHVMHIVSNVVGELAKNQTPIDILRATFPAGTLSGAPKIRAMEIIDELEPTKRGIYSGAIGYLSWHGNMDTAIAIRTAIIKDGTLYIQVGAGIVADSVPEKEWDETMNKGRAIFKAVAMSERGLTDHIGIPTCY